MEDDMRALPCRPSYRLRVAESLMADDYAKSKAFYFKHATLLTGSPDIILAGIKLVLCLVAQYFSCFGYHLCDVEVSVAIIPIHRDDNSDPRLAGDAAYFLKRCLK